MSISDKCQYRYDNALGILFKHYYGRITIEDIISTWEFAFINDLIPQDVKGFLLDYRQATIDMEVEKYTMISDFYKKNIKFFGDFKFGILMNTPKDIAISMLVETRDEGYHSKPFSTLEAAIDWVLN